MKRSVLSLKIGAALVLLILIISCSASANPYSVGLATNAFEPQLAPRSYEDMNVILNTWKAESLKTHALYHQWCIKDSILKCLSNLYNLQFPQDYPAGTTGRTKYWNHFGHGDINGTTDMWLRLWCTPDIYHDDLMNKAGIGSADIVFVASCFSYGWKESGVESPIKKEIIKQHPKYYIGYYGRVSLNNADGSSPAWDTARDFWINYLVIGMPVAYALIEAAGDNNLDLQFVGLWMEGEGDIDLSELPPLPPLPDPGYSIEYKW